MLLEEWLSAGRERPKGEVSVPRINLNHVPSLSRFDSSRGQLIFQTDFTHGDICIVRQTQMTKGLSKDIH